jgi:hypothetical protein
MKVTTRSQSVIQGYVFGAVSVLAITAFLKLATVLGEANALAQPDPVIGMFSNRQVLFAAALLELIVAFIALRTRTNDTSIAAVLWIGLLFLTYRIGLNSNGNAHCKCLGSVDAWFGLSRDTADVIASALLLYLLLPSACFLVLMWRKDLKRYSGRLPLLRTFLFTIALQLSCLASDYTTSGTISRGGRSYTFKAAVNGCAWHILLKPQFTALEVSEMVAPGQRVVVEDYIEAASDGEQFWEVTSFESSQNRGANAAFARHGPGNAPFGVHEHVIGIWYALASHCYLGHVTNNLIVPLDPTSSEGTASVDYRVRGTWALMEAPPFLPVSITIANNGTTNCMLRATATISTNGLTLPKDVTIAYFKQFKNANGTVTSQVYDSTHIRGDVVFSEAQIAPLPPILPGTTALVDYTQQKRGEAGWIALLTNRWPADAHIQKIVNERATTFESRKKLSRRNLALLLVVALVFPAAVLVIRQAKSKNSSKLYP